MKSILIAVLILAPAPLWADERTEAAKTVLEACFAKAESVDAEITCLGSAVRSCTPDTQNPANPDLLPCIEAETAVWDARANDRVSQLEEVIRASAETDDPCTPTIDECVGQIRAMHERMLREGEAACEQAAQIASVDGVPDLGRAACAMREAAIRAMRLAGLRKAPE